MAHYLFNLVKGVAANGPALHELAAGFLGVSMWGIDTAEAHGHALAPGDQILIYLGAPERVFIGRAELASAVHDWTPSEAQAYPGDSARGVLLAQVEEWDPPVPMRTVLSRIGPSEKAKADFQAGVVRITANEYETAVAVATARQPPPRPATHRAVVEVRIGIPGAPAAPGQPPLPSQCPHLPREGSPVMPMCGRQRLARSRSDGRMLRRICRL